MHPFLCSISFFFIFLLLIFNLPLSTSQPEVEVDFRFSNCSHDFDCGTLKDIGYPFWGRSRPEYCGHPEFKLECPENDHPVITIIDRKYRVLEINENNRTLHIARTDSWNGDCPVGPMFNTTIDTRLFTYPTPVTRSLTLAFGCSVLGREVGGKDFTCNINGNPMVGFSSWSDPASLYPKLLGCSTAITIPVLSTAVSPNPNVEDVLKQGFQVQYDVDAEECKECEKSDGQCGFNRTTSDLQCFCRRGPNKLTCSRGKNHVRLMIAIGVSTGVGVILLAFVFYFIFWRRRKLLSKSSALISRDITPDSSSKPDLEKDGNSYFQTPIFTYDELEEATNKFDSSKELGDGGYGTVYHGKLKDGRVVAVKRLYENNYKRVEQFMNEIAILSRLRHKNLVSLYGCTSRHSRELLLVYEFVPNGTVADHLHGDRAKSSLLTWSIRMGIAIESADALSYLHASDTIHRDVKTNNILLDNNFHVKVADFGLSRLFPNDVTHVSTAPQGTPGYVDPEYYQCYQLNDKSDVYSFGVVLIELISAKPAVDITRHRDEINLSKMAINKIHNDALHELVDPSLRFETNYTTKRMITMVAELAFRCLQQEKDMRPSMNEVLEALKDIENEQYKAKKAAEVDFPADARLLKNIQPPLSPNSVTDKWVSNSTTPNTSA